MQEAAKENDFTYIFMACINGKEWGLGKGKNKKTAEQNASVRRLS